MNDKEVTVLLIVIFILQLSIDISTNECLSRLKGKELQSGLINLSFHHFISVFANFGWLYTNKKILITNLILVLTILIGWLICKGCLLTKHFNNLCGYKHYEMFHDLFYYLNLKQVHVFYYITVIIIILNKIK